MLICTTLNLLIFFFFFFNDTATTEIYTLSLHDALPICLLQPAAHRKERACWKNGERCMVRSEEHTSELQSRQYLVCRLLLEKKKKKLVITTINVRIEQNSLF